MGLFDNKRKFPDLPQKEPEDSTTETAEEEIIKETEVPEQGTETQTVPETDTPTDETPEEEMPEEEIPPGKDVLENAEVEPLPEIVNEVVGTIYGNVGVTSFECNVCAHLERSEYVSVFHDDCGPVLCQVESMVRKTNLSLEKSSKMKDDTKIEELISAHIEVIGYRDDRGILFTPRSTFKAGEKVMRADINLVKEVLGLEINPKTDGYIGLLHGHGLPVALNINELLQRHACILAKTGGGKSYMSGDIIEELMKHNVTCMIIDPHGEYGAMREIGKPGDPKFNVTPRGYPELINEFAISNDSNNPNIKPLRFTFRTLEAREILELTRTKDMKALPAMKKALDNLRETKGLYSVKDLIYELSADENKHALLVTELQFIDEMNVFDVKGNRIQELVEEGKTTVINLKGVPPDIQQLIVKRLATFLFELRKKDSIPPLMLVVEEAHNYCPQVGTVISSKPLINIAAEGRKFGLGLMVISQRPAKIDKNVLSQCGTQIILKVTNPNDVKAIAASVEGLTNGMTDEITTMPIGMAMVVGAGIESPLLIEVRPRESKHGGAGVKVLEDD